MKKLRLSHSSRALQHYLKHGGVVAYATRAVFGLGCSPFSQTGLKKLLSIKQRPHHKGLIVIGKSLSQFKTLHLPLSSSEETRLNESWPGPVTFLVPATPHCLPLVRGHHRPKKVAIRVDAHPDTLALLNTIRMPLTSTSANLSGRRPIKHIRDCYRQLGKKVKIIPGRTIPRTQPSKIIDLQNEKIIRS